MNHPILPGNQLYPALVIFIEIPLKSWYVNIFHDSLFTCKQEVTLWLPQLTISVTIRETDLAGWWKGILVCLKLETSYRTCHLGSWKGDKSRSRSRDLGLQCIQSKKAQLWGKEAALTASQGVCMLFIPGRQDLRPRQAESTTKLIKVGLCAPWASNGLTGSNLSSKCNMG